MILVSVEGVGGGLAGMCWGSLGVFAVGFADTCDIVRRAPTGSNGAGPA